MSRQRFGTLISCDGFSFMSGKVFIEDESWYLLVHTVCKHLGPDNRCGIYETRPQICREYHTDNCEYEDHYVYDGYFETSEQVQDYIDSRFHSTPDSESFRSPRPVGLPVLSS
ncbi:MAG: YkgJ family cysteine cluster protein [Pirellulaceae bacterium]